jgi:hypothetical protein
MIETTLARMRAHHNNISRYRWLLETQLTELERGFIERRLSEEQAALAGLGTAAFPGNRNTTPCSAGSVRIAASASRAASRRLRFGNVRSCAAATVRGG